jgi:hypothetical protein
MPCWEPKAPQSLSGTSAPPRQATASTPATREYQAAVQESCDYCDSTQLTWRKCKLICAQCGHINKSCADL